MKSEHIDIIKNTMSTAVIAFIGTQNQILTPEQIALISAAVSFSTDFATNSIKKINQKQIEKVEEFQSEFFKQIDKNYKEGKILNPESFFNKEGKDSFEDVVDQTLLKVKEEHERKKIKYYGKLLSNLVYEKGIDTYEAFKIIEIFKQLSYKQLCLLSLFQKANLKKWDENNISDMNQPSNNFLDSNRKLLLIEFRELLEQTPLLHSNKYGPAIGANNNIFSRGTKISDINLNQLGTFIFNLSCIGDIDDSEKEAIININQLRSLLPSDSIY